MGELEEFMAWRKRQAARRRPRGDDDAVIVMSGKRADTFLDRVFGPADDGADDQGDGADDQGDGDKGDDDDDDQGGDDDRGDDPPTNRQGHRYFRS